MAGSTRTTSDDAPLTREAWARHEAALLGEMRHRVRNAIAVIRSIARRTAEHSTSVDDLAAHLDGRLAAFARTQAHLMVYPDARVDLEAILADELLAHQARAGENVSYDGPEVRLPLRAANTVGLALHELTTNAVKYGALDDDGGSLRVEWRVEEEDGRRTLRLDWRETVPGGIERPTHQGFGTELLENMLSYELEAAVTTDYAPGGLHCTIELPLGD